ncbi:MAG: RrF2 family transcriptional regulator [Pirellulaceae bacterium]
MLTKTSLSAIRVLTYLGLHGGGEPLSPRYLAEQLGDSPTYLAKVVRHLVKVKILRAHRGVTGGVVLAKSPRDITLLAIVEACQGVILADFCEGAGKLSQTCGFHQAAAELHAAIVKALEHWTLADFLKKPQPSKSLEKRVKCCLESSL